MKAEKELRDLIILAADKNMRFTLDSLLKRHKSLGIKELEFRFFTDTKARTARTDPWCYKYGVDLLADLEMEKQYRHALLIFDYDGTNAEEKSREEVEANLEALTEKRLGNWTAVICIEPELENWIWSSSPHVDRALGWIGKKKSKMPLRTWLTKEGYLTGESVKPKTPKEAMEKAMRCAPNRKKRSSAIYAEIAENVSVKNCSDPSFNKLKKKLREWFPLT